MASTNSDVYSNWAAKYFYVAFKLDGLGNGGSAERPPRRAQLRRLPAPPRLGRGPLRRGTADVVAADHVADDGVAVEILELARSNRVRVMVTPDSSLPAM